jgi:hypothetical protein
MGVQIGVVECGCSGIWRMVLVWLACLSWRSMVSWSPLVPWRPSLSSLILRIIVNRPPQDGIADHGDCAYGELGISERAQSMGKSSNHSLWGAPGSVEAATACMRLCASTVWMVVCDGWRGCESEMGWGRWNEEREGGAPLSRSHTNGWQSAPVSAATARRRPLPGVMQLETRDEV